LIVASVIISTTHSASRLRHQAADIETEALVERD
jgi:hypothetical protein